MRTLLKNALILVAACAASTGASAHIGHENASLMDGLAHPFGLDHLLAMKLFSVSQSSTRGKDFGDILSLIANNGVDVRSKEFEAICLRHASPKWLSLIRELS